MVRYSGLLLSAKYCSDGMRKLSHKGDFMIVNVPTKVIPIWFIEQWKKENAEPGSSLDIFITQMINDWELEEIRQSK